MSARGFASTAHPWCDVPAAVFNNKPAPHVTQRRPTCALCLWGGGAAHELAIRARRGALVVLETHSVEMRRAGKRHISFGVWLWCDVPAAASSTKPAPRVSQRRRACALCLWGGGAALELTTRTRRAAAVVVVSHSVESGDVSKRRRFFDARPLFDVPAAVFTTKPAPRDARRRRACALCFWGGGAAREPATRARRGALVVLGRYFVEERRAGETHFSFGVWPWCDVPFAAFCVKPAPCVMQRTSSREEAQHMISSFARAVPRSFRSPPLFRKTLRRREASLLRHALVVRCDS